MRNHRSRSFLTEAPLPPAEEYRWRCTRYLEIEIIRILLSYVQKANEFGMIVANGSIGSSDLWDSQSFRVLIWESIANVAMLSSELFLTSSYPFIEAYTSNVGQFRPMLRKHFNTNLPITSWDVADGQMLKCSGTYDVDLPELRRQYPDVVWNMEIYGSQVLNTANPKKLKVFRFHQESAQQMLHHTTTTTTYKVDVPISAVDALRHMDFAQKAADCKLYGRRIYPWQQNEIQVASEEEERNRRSLPNSDTTRNVRQRLILEGPIRPPLRRMQEEDYDYESEDMSTDELDIVPTTVSRSLEESKSLPEEEVLVVQAMDPGIAIARAINPTFQGQTLPASFRHYARMLEERLLAIERRSDSYLTGELSDEQLRSINDHLQAKLSRLFHPMLDTLSKDIQDFVENSTNRIDQRLLTFEDTARERVSEQIESSLSSIVPTIQQQIHDYQQSQVDSINEEMHTCFIRAEELSSSKLVALQSDILRQMMKLETRLEEMDSNAIKDRTLTSDQVQRTQQVMKIWNDSKFLTKEEAESYHQERLLQNLQLTADLHETLEASMIKKYEGMQTSLRADTITTIDTYLANHQSSMESLKETLLNQFRILGGQMMSTLQESQDHLKALELKVVSLSTTNTNLANVM